MVFLLLLLVLFDLLTNELVLQFEDLRRSFKKCLMCLDKAGLGKARGLVVKLPINGLEDVDDVGVLGLHFKVLDRSWDFVGGVFV